ncbi:hypothetical protein [Luteibacter sp.]|uniref:hypothetical protein n=1 Tax=Luteibacter sp. TaxID=1886636 RepID=UPI0028069369|nr:hypothetical protein [Luteibacter sp.]MDQ8050735.1 hypothetical protein [Luteibacter sp.]
MTTITETLNTVGQVSSAMQLAIDETAAWTLSTAGLTGYLAIERGDTDQAFETVRLVAGNDTNQFAGPGYFRFRLVTKAGAESVGVSIVKNNVVVQTDDSYVNSGELWRYTGQVEINGANWGKPYDTDLWIAGARRTNPTRNSQGIYVQHRVSGNLGGLVHDAGASELRLDNATNTGAGQSAFEASLVVTGGVNAINLACGVLSNFHTEGTPTGTATQVQLFRASQIPPLAVGFTIGTAYGIVVDQQIVGTNDNFSVYAPDGKSVFGPIVPKDVNTVALIVRGLAGQVAAGIQVQNSTPTTVAQFLTNGTGGIGGLITNTTLWVNNNLATGSVVAHRIRAHPSQTAECLRVENSGGTAIAGINKAGAIFTALNTVPADADIAAGQCFLWFDSTNGAAKLMIKAKQADGTVRSGSVALT